jgi:hypothetical protein
LIPHSFSLTWTSGFHQHEKNTLICLTNGPLGRCWVSKGVPGRQSLWPANLKGNLGSCFYGFNSSITVRSGETCALFLNPKSKGEFGFQGGRMGSYWKFWCHSQMSYCLQLGSPFDSWNLKQNPFWNQKKGMYWPEFQEMP